MAEYVTGHEGNFTSASFMPCENLCVVDSSSFSLFSLFTEPAGALSMYYPLLNSKYVIFLNLFNFYNKINPFIIDF